MIVNIQTPWGREIELTYPILNKVEYPLVTTFDGKDTQSPINIESTPKIGNPNLYDYKLYKIETLLEKGQSVAIIQSGDNDDEWVVTQEIITKEDIQIITDGSLDEQLICIFIQISDNKEISYSGEWGLLEDEIIGDINHKLNKNYKLIFISEY